MKSQPIISGVQYCLSLQIAQKTVTAAENKIALADKRIAEILNDADSDTYLYPSLGLSIDFGKPECSKGSFHHAIPHLSPVWSLSQCSSHYKYETVTTCLIIRNI